MRVLVVTVVHHPADARIRHRQIEALIEAGHSVTYAAPFTATGAAPGSSVRGLDLPQARGRDRLKAVRAARLVIHREAADHDIILLHDPELLLAVSGVRGVPIVWDVHEDTAAALTMKGWLPPAARPLARIAVRMGERWAERRCRLILAEHGYQARFRSPHPIVANTTPVPESITPPGDSRVMYLGSLTRARGAFDLIELARTIGPEGPRLHLVGPADAESAPALEGAQSILTWHGFVPNAKALELLDGAVAGISLLHDEANYRHSQPTKIIEYMAHGLPVITTPLPPARTLVEAAECGIVVPFNDVAAAAEAVTRLAADNHLRDRLAANGRAMALARYDWRVEGPKFVALLADWAAEAAK